MIENAPGDSEIVAAFSRMANALHARDKPAALAHAEQALALARSFNHRFLVVAEVCVEQAGGDVARTPRPQPSCPCSFCGAPDRGDHRLVAGAEAIICHACIDGCVEPLAQQIAGKKHSTLEVSAALEDKSCSFCGRSASEVTTMLATLECLICDGCVHLCRRALEARDES